MRLKNGVIYLIQPVFGRERLVGEAEVGTTWVEYTFTDGPIGDADVSGLTVDEEAPRGLHVFIPLTNVRGIAVDGSQAP
jgi:hypothetical protein